MGKAGVENGTEYVGTSLVISPLGRRILAGAETGDDELVVADLDLTEGTEARRRLPFGRDRRPRDYGAIVAEGH